MPSIFSLFPPVAPPSEIVRITVTPQSPDMITSAIVDDIKTWPDVHKVDITTEPGTLYVDVKNSMAIAANVAGKIAKLFPKEQVRWGAYEPSNNVA